MTVIISCARVAQLHFQLRKIETASLHRKRNKIKDNEAKFKGAVAFNLAMVSSVNKLWHTAKGDARHVTAVLQHA